MKINIEQIAPTFLSQLEQDGFSAQTIIARLNDRDSYKEAVKKIRQQTGLRYSKEIIKRALNGQTETEEDLANDDIADAINWFKSQRRRRWVLEQDEKLQSEKFLIDDLDQFSKGKPTDFIVWNCLGFEWQQEPQGGYPPCRITDNLESSIVLYFLPRLKQVAEKLSAIGNPTIIPMIPSSEATYESMWNYLQSRAEREQVVNNAVSELSKKLQGTEFPGNVTIKTMRWDEYLKSRGVAKEPEEYSKEGEQRIWESNDVNRITQEAVDNGVEYFGRFGIEVNPEKIAPKRIRYYGMYWGEGAAMSDIKKSGNRGVVVINFEELRVSKMALRGAKGNLSILTPVSDKEMAEYYKSEND
ncbi:hypothetical protein HZB78_04780 [Candidatus Collierbacteria bacterium]|nr:hypothetical protein [Candidatus Collierbacteria bacterium]